MIEIVTIIKELGVVVGIPLARGAIGWFINSMKDNVIDEIEWHRLGVTVVQIAAISLSAYFGLNGILNGLGVSIDLDLLSTTVGVTLIDLIRSWFKKKE